MANKAVPHVIGDVALHPRATQRSNKLLADLEAAGVGPLTQVASGSDRLRLVASKLFNLQDALSESSGTQEEVSPAVDALASNLS
jgi:hypothetical protein